MSKRSKSISKKRGIPKGYMTPEEWLKRVQKNITEIFEKHKKGLL
jgi:hypothetical protein